MTVITAVEETVADDMVNQLRRARLKATPNLLAILRVMAGSGGDWLCGEDIYRRMLLRGTPLGLATIYRLLKVLVSAGLVARVWQENCGSARAVYRRCPELTGSKLRVRTSLGGVWVDVDDAALREALLRVLREHQLGNGAHWEIELGRSEE